MIGTEPIALQNRLIILVFLAPVLVLAACTTGAGSADPADDSPSPEVSPESPAIDEDDVTVYFPRQAENPGIDFDDQPALGQLILDEQGCLRLNEAGPVVIWPHTGFSIEYTGDTINLVNEDEDYVIAHAGDDVSLHGTPVDTQRLDGVNLEHPLPDACADADQYLVTGPSISRADKT